ncbi:MAG TPA: hypothetical protein VMR62_11635 [Bryobacteraceae bacterium]|nr:hypothetical protein [Bryobacteraceae bacterium]
MSAYRQLRQYRNGNSAMEQFLPAPPSLVTDIGPYNVDDIIWKEKAVAGGVLGWVCTTAGQNGSTAVFSPFGQLGVPVAYHLDSTDTVGFTATAAQISGGNAQVDLLLSGTLGAGANIQLPTVAALLAALPDAFVGQTFQLRIVNASSANFAWTVTTNTGWTLAGTMSIAQNTWREFVLSITSVTAATATLTSVAVGTYS